MFNIHGIGNINLYNVRRSKGVDLTDRDQRSIFLGFEFRESVFFGYWSQILYFLGLLNKSCILNYFIFSKEFFGSSVIHQVLQ